MGSKQSRQNNVHSNPQNMSQRQRDQHQAHETNRINEFLESQFQNYENMNQDPQNVTIQIDISEDNLANYVETRFGNRDHILDGQQELTNEQFKQLYANVLLNLKQRKIVLNDVQRMAFIPEFQKSVRYYLKEKKENFKNKTLRDLISYVEVHLEKNVYTEGVWFWMWSALRQCLNLFAKFGEYLGKLFTNLEEYGPQLLETVKNKQNSILESIGKFSTKAKEFLKGKGNLIIIENQIKIDDWLKQQMESCNFEAVEIAHSHPDLQLVRQLIENQYQFLLQSTTYYLSDMMCTNSKLPNINFIKTCVAYNF